MRGFLLAGPVLAGLVLNWPSGPAFADTGAAIQAPPGLLCQQAIAVAEQAHAIPQHLLAAIGRVESGRRTPDGGSLPWPWTINAEGDGAFFDTKAQAIAAVRALQARGVRSIDVGCMQISLLHHPDAFATLDQAFDPSGERRLRRWLPAAALYPDRRLGGCGGPIPLRHADARRGVPPEGDGGLGRRDGAISAGRGMGRDARQPIRLGPSGRPDGPAQGRTAADHPIRRRRFGAAGPRSRRVPRHADRDRLAGTRRLTGGAS